MKKLSVYLLFALTSLLAQAGNDYLTELQSAARKAGLAVDPQWRTLVHYEPAFFSRSIRSVADDPSFFNSKQGVTDPQAELDATLARFFDDQLIPPQNQLPQCRFAARYYWLKQKLAFDPARLPEQACPRLQTWLDALNPAGATLIFPSAYINSPATMFGHTLLRIDAVGQKTNLLNYAINYAAEANDTNGFAFAFKGLMGFYPGVMSNSPYYKKVREYSDMESRDIWEYRLTLQRPEVLQLLRHAWELGSTRFDYYFFDENCSYLLLTLLDAARPGLNLAQQFPLTVIPGDTVKAVVNTPGLVADVHYRPSTGTELIDRAARLSDPDRADAIAVAEGKLAPVALRGQPKAAEKLEFADRLLSFRGQAGKIAEDVGMPRLHAIQAERSQLPVLEIPEPAAPARPESGHGSSRADLYAGMQDSKAALALQFHPAYHELLDQEAGYRRGAQIRFGDVRLTQRAGERWQLEQFLPVDIVSLSPRADWYAPPSWKVRFGWERAFGRDHALAPMLAGGPGLASEQGNLMWYCFLDNQLLGQRDLERGWAVGSGLLLGSLWDITGSTRVQVEAGKQWFAVSTWQKTQARLKLRQALSRSDNLLFSAEWQKNEVAGVAPEGGSLWLGWQRYF